MKKGIKKILSYVLALAMVVAMIPATSFAVEVPDGTNPNIKFDLELDGLTGSNEPAFSEEAWWGTVKLVDIDPTLVATASDYRYKKVDETGDGIQIALGSTLTITDRASYVINVLDASNEIIASCTVKIDPIINTYATDVNAVTAAVTPTTTFEDLVEAYETALANLNLDADQEASIASNLAAEGMVKVAEDGFLVKLQDKSADGKADVITALANANGETDFIEKIEKLEKLNTYLEKTSNKLGDTEKGTLTGLVTDTEKAQEVIDLFTPMDEATYVQDYADLKAAFDAYDLLTDKQKTLVQNSYAEYSDHKTNKDAVDAVITAVTAAGAKPYVKGLSPTAPIGTIILIETANALATGLTQDQKDLFATTEYKVTLDALVDSAAAAKPVQVTIEAVLTAATPNADDVLAAQNAYDGLNADAQAMVDATGLDAKVTTAIEAIIAEATAINPKVGVAVKAVLDLRYADEITVAAVKEANTKVTTALKDDTVAQAAYDIFRPALVKTYLDNMMKAVDVIEQYQAFDNKFTNKKLTEINAFKTAYNGLTEDYAKAFADKEIGEGKATELIDNLAAAEAMDTALAAINAVYDSAENSIIIAAWNQYCGLTDAQKALMTEGNAAKIEKLYPLVLANIGYKNTATDGVTVTVVQGMTENLNLSDFAAGSITKVELKVKKNNDGKPTSGTAGTYGTNVTVSIEATGTIGTETVTKTVEIADNKSLLLKITAPSNLKKNDNLKVYSVDTTSKAATQINDVTFDSNHAQQFAVAKLGDFAIYGDEAGSDKKGGGSSSSSSSSKKTDDTTSSVTPPAAISQFTDVSSHWAYEAIKYVVDNNLFNGTSTTKFSPDMPMTRAMLVTVLYRYEKQPTAGSNTFTDVAAGTWYSDAVAWASNNGVVQGVGNNKFSPNTNLTREQIAVIFYNYAKFKGVDVSATKDISSFSDASKVASWAQTEMKWASAVGLIQGRPGNTIDPQASATRAEVATILQRFIQNVVTNTSNTTTDTTNSTDKKTEDSTDTKTTK